MDTFIEATILGLATASILAIAASGLVLTYTTTGIFNFAHGALGMLGAFTYWQLRFDWAWPAPLALATVLLVLAPIVGGLIEVVIMRGLTDAPETVRVVVSISLLVALLGLGLWIWSPQEAHPIVPFWGHESIDIGGLFTWLPGTDADMTVIVTYHEITAFTVAILLAIGLRLLLFRSRPGLAMRAAVDDRPLSTLNGARPDRSAMLAWAIGCGCAALGGILMSPVTTLSHISLTLLIVNAYAAAMIGRLRSLPMTFAGAVLLGLIDSWGITYLPDDSQLVSRLRFVAPVIVLFVVLLVLRQPRPRGHAVQRTREMIPRPRWAGSLITAAVFVGAGAYMSGILTDPDAVSIARIVALSIIGLSLVPLVGFAGQLSLCQMTFAGIGAVVMAHHGQGGSLLGLLYAAVLTGIVGAVVALPAIRLGGLYLALATAAFAVIMDQWVFGLEPFDVGPFTIKFFPLGSVAVDRIDLPGTDTGGGLLIVLSVIFALFYLLVVAIRRSTFGQRLLAMKDSPPAAATIGMNLNATKMAVFALSAAMAGVGGALYGGTLGSASPDRFQFFTSLPMLLLGVVGGIGSAAGAILAGVLLGATPILVNSFPWYENISRVLPGTMGIALGRNPNGIIQELRVGFAPLAKAPVALAATLAGTAAVLGLRWVEAIDGGLFALLLIAAVLVPGLVLRLRDTRTVDAEIAAAEGAVAGGVARSDGAVVDEGATVPLEWVGIDRPFTREDVALLDRELGLEGAR